MWERKLSEMKYKSLVSSPTANGMPGSKNVESDKIGKIISEENEIELIISGLMAKAEVERRRIMNYIDSIEDSLIRQIVQYRNIELKKWNEIANLIGGNNNENNIKQMYHRYLKSH